MSSFSRFAKAALTALALGATAGCGFTPLAAIENPDGARRLAISDLAISAGSPDVAYELRKYLDRRVSVRASAPERLRITVKLESENLAVRQDDTVTRINLTATATYQIVDASGDVQKTGAIVSTTAINSTTDFFATRTSRREAEALLAQDIGRRLIAILYSQRLRGTN